MNESQTNHSKRTGAQDFIISVAKIRIFSDVDVMVMRKGVGMRMRLRCLWRLELKRLQGGEACNIEGGREVFLFVCRVLYWFTLRNKYGRQVFEQKGQ